MSRFFLNNADTLIDEAADGFLKSTTAKLAKLDAGDSDIRVIVRSDWTKEKANKQVALISGGGSGHEPMHAGFVGEGMLTAAVLGGLFASPSIDAVLAAILHVAGDAGVVVIVKAYTGDCLNFGLAVEKAKSMGIKAEIVIFSDDVAIPNHPRPRGLAGTVMLHKILGHKARTMNLNDLVNFAHELIPRISTIGVSITSCSTPSSSDNNRVPSGSTEIGLGIHGEPGIETVNTQNVDQLVSTMFTRLNANEKKNLAILLNNLGGVSELEMNVITSSILRQHKGIKMLVGPVAYCTSLDMKGFSITTVDLTPEIEEALVSEVSVASWKLPVSLHEPETIKAFRNHKETATFEPSNDEKISKYLSVICDTIIENTQHLNDLDQIVGDGDCGTTLEKGAKRVKSLLTEGKLPMANINNLLSVLSDNLSYMGGSSGVLLSIMLIQTKNSLNEGKSFIESLEAGINKMMLLGGAKPGMRTMIDAFVPAVKALPNGLEAAAKAAEEGAESTKSMNKAGAGRSSYLNADTLIGHPDPGATAVALVFRALATKA